MEVKKDNKLENNGKKEGAWWQPPLMLFAKFSSWIVAPVLLGALIGNWLDKKYHGGSPLFIFIIIGISFIISMFGLVKEVSKEYRKIEDEEKKKKER